MTTLLVGNPNAGKTTLFNALTSGRACVGNWPGVTVETKSGHMDSQNNDCCVTDIPGLYSLDPAQQQNSIDADIATQALQAPGIKLILNIVDATQLEKHLYLTSQLLELGMPMIVVLNKTDLAAHQGIDISVEALSESLGCPVIPIQAHRKKGLDSLKEAIEKGGKLPKPLQFSLPDTNTPDFDILAMDARYSAVNQLVSSTQHKHKKAGSSVTRALDKFLLHRVFALPLFGFIMYAMFFVAMGFGEYFQSTFERVSTQIFVDGTNQLLQSLHSPTWLVVLLANGVGRGLSTTITFIPVMVGIFMCLTVLELSGYMARAAFVVDRMMRVLGLPGKSFVPMIVGFGCNVPAIMATRILETERDRRLTMLMIPFMSCSARLAIYAIFVSSFFPAGGHNVVFSLYLMGILMAVCTGLMLKKRLFQGELTPLLIELPDYQWPTWRQLISSTYSRVAAFISRAGRFIVLVCIVLSILNGITLDGHWQSGLTQADSVLSGLGRLLTPIFYPMGISSDNWPATVGLITGSLAKEVVIGTLNTLYAQVTHTQPLLSHYFDGAVGAYAYLLFVLLYIPCVSTMGVIKQESTRRLMWFSIAWSLFVAYAVATVFYQLMTFMEHPYLSTCWVLVMFSCMAGVVGAVMGMRLPGRGDATTTA